VSQTHYEHLAALHQNVVGLKNMLREFDMLLGNWSCQIEGTFSVNWL